MQVTEALIEQFFLNQCTAEEAAAVKAWLQAHPGYVEEKFKDEWNSLQQFENTTIPETQQLLKSILLHIKPTQFFIGRKTVYGIAVAASLLVVAITAWWMHQPTSIQKNIHTVAATKPSLANTLQWITKANSGKTKQLIQLPDGSTVQLHPQSFIQYANNYNVNERVIKLEGTAFFDVKKNKLKPFIVQSSYISTTALGTSFEVSSTTKQLGVKLYTGKVVIQKIKEGIRNWSNPIYLLPGEQLNFSVLQNGVSVQNKTVFEVKQKTQTVIAAEQQVYKMVNGSMVFNSAPLNKVFEILAAKSTLKIEFNSSAISGMYFTGNILPTDAIPAMIKTIAEMNQLVVEETTTGFIIKK